MNLERYEKVGRAAYADLAQTVGDILVAAIRAQPGIRLQHIQRRAKDPTSLRNKLEKDDLVDTNSVETAIKDLAGCRAVFYTNSDVTRFLQSGIVRENFDVDWERTKIHHPVPETDNADTPFISNNYVVTLKADRVKLPEYAHLAGMRCEVQVQTSLNHAWSETEHDILYKRPNLKGFGSAAMNAIEERMKGIMQKYLLPAGYEFQKVQNDFDRLASGKELFDKGALETLGNCDDNNTRAELLEKFKHYVLPNYDNVNDIYPDIRATLKNVVRQAAITETRPRETPFGSIPGRSADDVVAAVADIIDYLRYVNVENAFDDIREMYLLARTDRSRQRWIKSVQELAGHDMDVWSEAGPAVQYRLVQHIDRLSDREIQSLRPFLTSALETILGTEIAGTSMTTYNAVTLHRGAVVSSDMLSNARGKAIEILRKMLTSATDEGERRNTISALMTATRWPDAHGAQSALIVDVLKDARSVVEIFIEAAPQMELEVLQHVEHDLLWLRRHSVNLPAQFASDSRVASAAGELDALILRFRDLINTDELFVVHKTLVGFESVFPPAWEAGEFDYESEQRYREQQIDALVKSVSVDNAEHWFAILERCAQTKSNDMATFPSFGQFLEKLGRVKAEISLLYIERMDDPLTGFLPAVLKGIDESPLAAKLPSTLTRWVGEKKYLSPVIWFLRHARQVDTALLENALRVAIECDDRQAVLNAVSVAVNRHDDVQGGLINDVLMPAISFLASKDNMAWIQALWLRPRASALFNDLSAEQGDTLLEAMRRREQIDHHDENVLAGLARRWPEKIIDFFIERLDLERSKTLAEYRAIPYTLTELGRILSAVSRELLARLKRYFEKDKTLFYFRGARLVVAIFPNSTTELNAAFGELIASGDTPGIEFVIAVLRAYSGQPFLQPLCKQIVEVLPEQHVLLGSVELVMDSTGVVHGEFGMVTAYQQKRTAVLAWLEDGSATVRAFAKQHIYGLEQRIAAEQRRSEEELALRKLDYDTP